MTLQLRQRMLILYQRLFLFSLFYSGRSDHPLLAIYISKKPSKPITSPYVFIILCFLLFINNFSSFYLYFQKQTAHRWCAVCFCGKFLNRGFNYSLLFYHELAAFCDRYSGSSICASPLLLLQCSRLRCPE